MKKSLYRDYLESITKKELETLINRFSLFGNVDKGNIKKLKKDELVVFIMASVKDYINNILNEFTWERFAILKKFVDNTKIVNKDLSLEEKATLDTLLKFSFLNAWHERNTLCYTMYDDIKRIFHNQMNNKQLVRMVKKNSNVRVIMRGIIYAYGAITIDNLYLLLQKEYPSIERGKFSDNIKKYLFINDDFKLSESKEGSIAYSKSFKTIASAKKYAKKDIYSYTYEEYISWGNTDYKYNREYKKFYKYIKRKYMFTKKDLNEFNCVLLSKYVDLYRINKKQAMAFIKETIKTKFEFKNETLESKLLELIMAVAEAEPKWGVK